MNPYVHSNHVSVMYVHMPVIFVDFTFPFRGSAYSQFDHSRFRIVLHSAHCSCSLAPYILLPVDSPYTNLLYRIITGVSLS